MRGGSSAGQSTRLIIGRSSVQVRVALLAPLAQRTAATRFYREGPGFESRTAYVR